MNSRQNVKVEVKGNICTVTFNLKEGGEATKSSNGKNLAVASTGGFTAIPGTDCKLSLNVIRPATS